MPQPPQLLEWSELPDWQKEDNSYVQTGYRVATPSFIRCLQSWGYLHNETGTTRLRRSSFLYLTWSCTVNIFSHLLGAALFFGLPSILVYELTARFATANTGDLAVFGIYLFGVAGCYTLSVLFHTLMSHSARGFNFGLQLDFQGIILLMWSATAPMVYYTFLFEPKLQKVYWSLVRFARPITPPKADILQTTIFAVLASIITFTPAFRKPATKPLRAGVFGSLALSTLFCVVHGFIAHGWDEQNRRFPAWGIGLTLLFNTIGATVYVLRFPESFWPRRFDIFGASHQLMHISILIASIAWLFGMITAFDNAHARI